MKKTMITILTAVILIFSAAGSTQAATTTVQFKDVKDTHWAKAQIMLAAQQGYVSGYPDGTFGPSKNITRAEFAALLSRISKLSATSQSVNVFADVKTGHWAKEAVEKIANIGLIRSIDFPSGFKPNQPLTRYEMVNWMVNGLAIADPSFKDALSDTADTLVPFTEYYKGGIAKVKIPYIAVARGTQLSLGFPDGSFGLDKPTTRAEVAVMIQKYLALEGKKADIYPELNELREVGTTGTNMISLANAKVGKDSHGRTTPLQNIIDKPITTAYKKGIVKVHRYIVVDATKSLNENVNGVYGNMFYDKSLSRYDDSYSVYIEISYIPLVDNMDNLSFLSGVDDITGSQVYGNKSTEYGFLTNPGTKTDAFYIKGVERRYWVSESVRKESYVVNVLTNDGSSAAFVLQ